MIDPKRTPRSAVSRKHGHPLPWRVEAILEAFERPDGDIEELATAFDCHAETDDEWSRRFELRTDSYIRVRDRIGYRGSRRLISGIT